jgi:uncharacterized SAM-binding protein YcdF (DUF218 family)
VEEQVHNTQNPPAGWAGKRTGWFVFTLVLSIPVLLLLFHNPILKAMGNYLILEDSIEEVEALFVLGGGTFDRGNEAVKLYNNGHAPQIVCTSENIPSVLEVIDTLLTEAQLSQKHIANLGVPLENVIALNKATSTKEEAKVIHDYCKEHGLKKVMILSSKFHTRRVNKVFNQQFENSGIELVFRGAPSSKYKENKWWQKESGLLFVNNEYIKLMYYKLAYGL